MSTLTDGYVRDTLEAFEGADAKGQEIGAASLHPFPARMPLSVAEHLIERMTEPGETILDPMVGSGTTLIAARRLGRRGIGYDRDPLAVLLSRVATRNLSKKPLESTATRILERARDRIKKIQLPSSRKQLPEEDQQFLRYWFPPRSQKQLLALAGAIGEEPKGPERDLSWAVFSSLIIAKSAGASFALDISRSRPHKRSDKAIVLPFDGWHPRFRRAIVRHPFLDANGLGKAMIESGDARSLPLKEASVDLVLTSPPYLNAVNYIRSHKFSLVWMGYDLATLRELRGTMVGTERGLWSVDSLPSGLERQFEEGVAADRRRAMIRQYLSDLRKVLVEAKRVLRPSRLLVLVVGPLIISRQEPDAASIVSELASNVGLVTVGRAHRKLSTHRRSLPPPSWAKNSPLGRRMEYEVLVALRK